jgi:biotin operon repressor
MHAARVTSPRLQRVLALLRDGRPHSTREIVRKAGVVAVSACVSELRTHGAKIDCRHEVLPNGQRRFFYTMTEGPKVQP